MKFVHHHPHSARVLSIHLSTLTACSVLCVLPVGVWRKDKTKDGTPIRMGLESMFFPYPCPIRDVCVYFPCQIRSP